MAASMVDSALGKSVECPVCLSVFEQPKVLPCGHCVCEACVRRLNLCAGRRVTCPVCRAVRAVPSGGFPTNFTLAAVVEQVAGKGDSANKYKCVTCAVSLPPKELYVCADCERRVFCAHCCLDAHKAHQTSKLTDMIEQYNAEKAAWQAKAKESLKTYGEQMRDGQPELHNQLKATVDQLKGMIDACKQLNDLYASRFIRLSNGCQTTLESARRVGTAEPAQSCGGELPPFEFVAQGERVRLEELANRVNQFVEERDETKRTIGLFADGLTQLYHGFL